MIYSNHSDDITSIDFDDNFDETFDPYDNLNQIIASG